MKDIIETLYPMNRCLLGEGYDNALEYLKHLIDLKVIEIPSGTKLGSWTVPDEWIVRDAWVKLGDEKIIDYKKNPLSLVVGSMPIHGFVKLDELRRHWNYSDEMPNATPYVFKYYEKDWGFCIPKTQVREKIELVDENGMVCENGVCTPALKDFDPSVGKVQIEGIDYQPKWKDKLPQDGEYEVFIDTEFRPGKMKLGVHTIPGKSDREILLFAHLDHPFQANDNLSAVACLVDLATKLKAEHTVKIIFCPETIGSVGYALTQDISKVDFVIAIDICGNDNTLLMQKSWDVEHRINRVAHVAIQGIGDTYRKGMFRNTIGSDEYAFNDPKIGIQGIMLSRHPYKEYHTSEDTPDKINYASIEKTGLVIQKIIEYWEKDYIPVRNFKGPLMRSKYGLHTVSPQVNLSYDYFFYSMDGKRSVAELCCEYGLNFEFTLEALSKMQKDGLISGPNSSEKPVKASRKKKHLTVRE